MDVEMHGTHDRLPAAVSRAARHAARLAAALLCAAGVSGVASAAQLAPRSDERPPLGDVPAGVWDRDRAPIPEGWILVETRSYQLQSRIDLARTTALGKHLEALLPLYRDLLPSTGGSGRLVVKLLADEDEYLSLGRSDARYGRYDPASGDVLAWNSRVVLGDTEVATGIRLSPDRIATLTFAENQAVLHLADAATQAYTPDLGATLARCCWQQYLGRRVWPEDGPALPAWLLLGLSEHFATAAGDGRRPYRTGLNEARIRELRWQLIEGDAVPLSRLLFPEADTPPFEVGSGPPAQGWAWVHFLLTSEEPGRRQLVPRLLADSARSRNFQRSVATVFADVDLERLQSDWRTWAEGLRCADPLAELVRDYGDKIRPDQFSGDADLTRRYGWLWRRRNGPQPAGSP